MKIKVQLAAEDRSLVTYKDSTIQLFVPISVGSFSLAGLHRPLNLETNVIMTILWKL